MELNPAKYFIKRYHSRDLRPSEMKRMLNMWLPFIFNRVKIEYISDDFTESSKDFRGFHRKSWEIS